MEGSSREQQESQKSQKVMSIPDFIKKDILRDKEKFNSKEKCCSIM